MKCTKSKYVKEASTKERCNPCFILDFVQIQKIRFKALCQVLKVSVSKFNKKI